MEHLSAPGGNAASNGILAAGGAAASPAPAYARGAADRDATSTARSVPRTFARRIDCWSDDADEVRPAVDAR